MIWWKGEFFLFSSFALVLRIAPSHVLEPILLHGKEDDRIWSEWINKLENGDFPFCFFPFLSGYFRQDI
jgi:hypothetical protein